MQKFKGRTKKPRRPERRDANPVVIPYMHRVIYNLKRVGNKYGVPIVFSAPHKLAKMCPKVCSSNQVIPGCGTKHAKPYVRCATGVVYEIPLSCGKVYVGQTGRCINQRAKEHERSLGDEAASFQNLPAHCSACRNCEPRLEKIKILSRSKDRLARELSEAFFITQKGDMCVSTTSISLRASEFEVLNKK